MSLTVCFVTVLYMRWEGTAEYTEKGIKNCTNCLVPHKKENYDRIIEKLLILIERVREQ